MKNLGKIGLVFLGLILVAAVSAGVSYLVLSNSGKQLKLPFTSTEVKSKEFGPIVQVGEFTVNLHGDSSFIKTDISIELVNKNDEETIKTLLPVVKDKIIGVLSNKTLDDIKSTKGKESLRNEILEKINEAFGTEKVRNVLFTSYVFQ